MLTNSVIIGISPDTFIESECILCCHTNASVKSVQCNESIEGILCKQEWLLCDICQVRNFNIRKTNCLICSKSASVNNDIENNTIIITPRSNSSLCKKFILESSTCLGGFVFFVVYHLTVFYILGRLTCWVRCSDSFEINMVIGMMLYIVLCALAVSCFKRN